MIPSNPPQEGEATTIASNVSEVDFGNLSDIPACLEAMATELRNGEHKGIRVAAGIFWSDNNAPIVCGWGKDASDIVAIGLFHAAASWLTMQKVNR